MEEFQAFSVHRSACLSPTERDAVVDFIQRTTLEPPPEQSVMDRSAELLAKVDYPILSHVEWLKVSP